MTLDNGVLDLRTLGFEPVTVQNGSRYRHCRTGLEFVLLSAGSFVMGSEDPDGHTDERPSRLVTLTRPFLICVTPCSQEAWKRGAEGLPFEDNVEELAKSAVFPVFGAQTQMPIYHVSWNACTTWCSHNGLELPTEAQWEYACRAGTTTRFWFGDVDLRDWDALDARMWSAEHNEREAPMLKSLEANAWGLHDVHGTIWEWCRDAYETDYYTRAPAVDPCNLSPVDMRVRRGGSWDVPAICCRSSARHCDASDYRHGTISFRPALTL